MQKIILALLLLLVVHSQAATYYVAKTGSDSADGSSGAPWLTVSHAADSVNAGDTVIIGDGVYEEYVDIVEAGTWTGAWTANVRQFEILANGVTITNLSIGNSNLLSNTFGVDVRAGVQQLRVDNCLFDFDEITNEATDAGGVYLRGTNNIVTGCVFRDFKGSGCFMVTGMSNVISHCTATNLDSTDFAMVFGWNHRVEYNLIADTVYPQEGNHPDFIQTFGDHGESCTNLVVDGNSISNAQMQLFMLTVDHDYSDIHHIVFRNNIFANVAYQGQTAVPHTWFFNNVFYRCGSVNAGVSVLLIWSALYPEGGGATNAIFLNNVFLENGEFPDVTSSGWWAWNPNGHGTLPVTSDYNYFGGPNFTAKTDIPDTHFVNGGDLIWTDYAPQAGSPLIGAGTNLSAYFTTDISGDARTTWDIGAYEYSEDEADPEQPAGAAGSARAARVNVETLILR